MKYTSIILPILVVTITPYVNVLLQQLHIFKNNGANNIADNLIFHGNLATIKNRMGSYFRRNESFKTDIINQVLEDIHFDKKLQDKHFQIFDANVNIIEFVEATFSTAIENKILARTLSRVNLNMLANEFSLYNSGTSKGFENVINKEKVIMNLWHYGYVLDTLTKTYFDGFSCSSNSCFNKSDVGARQQINHIADTFEDLKNIPSGFGNIYDVSRNSKTRMVLRFLQESFEERENTLNCRQVAANCKSQTKRTAKMTQITSQNIMWAAAADLYINFPRSQNPFTGVALASLIGQDESHYKTEKSGWMGRFEESFRKDWLDLYTAWDIMFCINIGNTYLNLECLMKLLIPEQGGFHKHYDSEWYAERRAYSLSIFCMGKLGEKERVIPSIQVSKELINIFQEEIHFELMKVLESSTTKRNWSGLIYSFFEIHYLFLYEYLSFVVK